MFTAQYELGIYMMHCNADDGSSPSVLHTERCAVQRSADHVLSVRC